jgi:hypothetical protein
LPDVASDPDDRDPGLPAVRRDPRADRSFVSQKRRASDRLMTATRGVSGVSAPEKTRPWSNGTPIVEK